MNWSEIKTGAGVVAFAIIGTVIVYGLLWAAGGEKPSYGVRIIKEAAPDTGVLYTQPKAEFAYNERRHDIDVVSTGRVIFTISPLLDGKFTVTINPEITWDEAGQEFWRVMEKFAAPNTLIWESKP